MHDCGCPLKVSVRSMFISYIYPRKENQLKQKKKEVEEKAKAVRRMWVIASYLLNTQFNAQISHSPQVASSLFLAHNSALVPPYRVLIDTNFINFSLQNKLDLMSGMMDCLYAKCTQKLTCHNLRSTDDLCRYSMCNRLRPCRTGKTRPSLPCSSPVRIYFFKSFTTSSSHVRVARDPRFERLPCSHTGTYADDCLIQRVTAHKTFIVATCDRELRRRVRKIPGVPLMYIVRRRYAIERLPDQGAPI